MEPKKLFFTATCALLCFLFSCRESNDAETPAISVSNDILESACDSQTNADINEYCDSVSANSAPAMLPETIGSLAQLEKLVINKPSYFVVKAGRDTVIKCREGTLLSIPANAFLNAGDGKPVAGEVKITVREFYRISDMLTKGLTTTSNGKLLETGGMINISAFNSAAKDSCVLKPGKNIMIAMANSGTQNADGMLIFNGVHDSSVLNWAPRGGLAGLAQAWKLRSSNYAQAYFSLDPGFVFPDEVPKEKPSPVSVRPEDLQAEIKLSIRDILAHRGVATKKANAYIDTSGNLHCYRVGDSRQLISFPERYEPMMNGNLKVNVAVEVTLSYRSNLNFEYYQKLFKMKKCKPDSLVAVTVTLNPNIRLTDTEKLRKVYKSAITVSQFRKKQRVRDLKMREYEKKVKALRLQEETEMTDVSLNADNKLASAQNYFLLNTSQLGWINCDRFYETKEKTDYFVRLNEKASLLIVFSSIKSIMASDQRGVFHGVPLGEKITIVGLRTENGQLLMAMQETTVTEKPFDNLIFSPVTVKEYKSKLERLNRS